MPDLITLSCPKCGGKLQITADIDRFACAHCGSEHIVRRSGGTISLAPVLQSLEKIQDGASRTASELAIARLAPQLGLLRSEAALLRQSSPWVSTAIGILLLITGVPSLLCVVLLVLASSPDMRGSTAEFEVGLLFIVGYMALGVYLIGRDRKTRRENAKRIADLNSAIARLSEEIEQHKNIVSTA